MNIFYPNTYTDLELACIKSDIYTEKLNILYEAVENVLNSNYMEAELKVYTENGTYNDLSMLYIEAKEEADKQKTGIIGTLINTIKNLCKKIKNFFINIFGKKKDSIPDQVKISKEDNNKIDTFNEVCDTVKPLLNGNVAEDELKEKSAFCTKKLALIGGGAIAATGISAVVVVNKNTIIEKLNKLFNNTNEIDSGLEKMKKSSNNDNKKGLLTVIQTVISGIGKFASGLINKITGESKSNTNESQSEESKSNTNESQSEQKMRKYDEIEEGIADNDIERIREAIGSICYVDRDFSKGEFDRVLRYVESKGIKVKDDTLDGKLISDGKTAYTDEDFTRAIFMLKKNFCNERIEDVKKIGKTLYKKTVQKEQNKSNQNQTDNKEKESKKEDIPENKDETSKSEQNTIVDKKDDDNKIDETLENKDDNKSEKKEKWPSPHTLYAALKIKIIEDYSIPDDNLDDLKTTIKKYNCDELQNFLNKHKHLKTAIEIDSGFIKLIEDKQDISDICADNEIINYLKKYGYSISNTAKNVNELITGKGIGSVSLTKDQLKVLDDEYDEAYSIGVDKRRARLRNRTNSEKENNENKSDKKEDTRLTNQNQTDNKEKESKKEDIPENKEVKPKTDDKKDDEFEFKDEREKLLKKQRNGNISISESERLRELNNKYETFYKIRLKAKRVAREKPNNDDDELDLNDLPESKPDPEADKNHRKRLVELQLKRNFKTIDADKNYIESVIKNLENIKGTLPDIYYNKVYTKLQDILKNGDFDEPDDIMNSIHETIKKYVYNSSTKVSSEEWKQLEKFIKDCGYTEVDVKPGDDITPFRTYFERPISANNEGTPNTIKEIQLKPFVVKCEDSLFKLCGKCTYYK